MRKITIPAFIALFLSLALPSQANASELCGDGPEMESIFEQNRIRIRPKANVQTDFANLQQAIDEIESGGVIELCEGEFFLGDNPFNRKTIQIKKGLTIKGVKSNGEWLTVIKGGGSIFAPGSAVFGIAPDIHAGPFIVNSLDDNPVIFENVWLREWISEAVIVAAANGFHFIDSKITHPITLGLGYPTFTTNFVHAILIFNPESTGELVVTDNEVDLTWFKGKKFHDVQFLALFGSPPTTFTDIEISRNHIITPDEAFELTANTPEEPSRIVIADNTIEANIEVYGIWPFKYPIFVANNSDTQYVRVDNNHLTLSNAPRMEGDKDMGGFVLTGENFEVTNNHVDLNEFDGKLMQLGSVGNLLVVDFGASVMDSIFENNTFTGTAKGPGIEFSGGFQNKSRDNIFYLGTSMNDAVDGSGEGTGIDATFTRTCNNQFFGETGTIIGDPERPCD